MRERVSIRTNDSSIKGDPATAAFAVVLPEPTVNAAWAQSGGNASKSMGHPALGATRAKLWEASIAGSTNKQRLASSPVVADNRLFVVDTEAVVSAFAAAAGADRKSRVSGKSGS